MICILLRWDFYKGIDDWGWGGLRRPWKEVDNLQENPSGRDGGGGGDWKREKKKKRGLRSYWYKKMEFNMNDGGGLPLMREVRIKVI